MRDRVVFIPYISDQYHCNENEFQKQSILKKFFTVDRDFTHCFDIRTILKTKAVIMGWIEERLDTMLKIRIIMYKFFGAKVIWTFHNKEPHNQKDSDSAQKNMIWLSNISDAIIIHSKSSIELIPGKKRNQKKAFFIPQIEYTYNPDIKDTERIRNEYGISPDSFVFLCFGMIKRYKRIEACINAFKDLRLENSKLVIAGMPIDKEYADSLISLADGDRDIILDFRYIYKPLLTALISVSDVVIIPYNTETCINSGVMIHAFSAGKPVIMPEMCSSIDYMNSPYLFIYENDGIKEEMYEAYRSGKKQMALVGDIARKDIQLNNNIKVAEEAFAKLLKL